MAVVALTHVNGSYGDMLYMAGWRQQNHDPLQPRLSEIHHFSSGSSFFIGVNRQVTPSKSVSFLEKVGKLLEENK